MTASNPEQGPRRWPLLVIAVLAVAAVAAAVTLWRHWQSQQRTWQAMQSAQSAIAAGLPPYGERQMQGPQVLPLPCVTSPQGCPFDRRVYQIPAHLEDQVAATVLHEVLAPAATTDVTCQADPQGVTCVTLYGPTPGGPAVQVTASTGPRPTLDGANAVWVTEVATTPAPGSSR